MPSRPGSPLRGHRDFNKLWFGQAVSSVGSQVTLLAMPLTAVLYLHASAGQLGLLTAAGLAAYCGPSLLFGVMADRVRRRTLMIAADIGRTVVIALVPVLAWLHSLNMPVLYAVELVQGGLTVIFEVAYRAYLPDLVGTDALLSGNSRLQATASVAQVGGPGLSGALVSLLGAPFALLADAGSFVVSWASLLAIRTPEPPPRRERTPGGPAGVRGVFSEVWFGLRFIYRNPVLRAVAGSAGSFNFFSQLQLTLYVLYAARDMHMSPGEIGLILVGFGIGGVVSSATRRARAHRAWLRALAGGRVRRGGGGHLLHPPRARARGEGHVAIPARVLRGRIRDRRHEHRHGHHAPGGLAAIPAGTGERELPVRDRCADAGVGAAGWPAGRNAGVAAHAVHLWGGHADIGDLGRVVAHP